MPIGTTTKMQEFEAVFHQLVADLRLLCLEEYQLPTRVWDRFEKVGVVLVFPLPRCPNTKMIYPLASP